MSDVVGHPWSLNQVPARAASLFPGKAGVKAWDDIDLGEPLPDAP